MNASTSDFSSMTTEELIHMARALALEIYERCKPISTLVARTIKKVKSWLF